MLQARFEVPPRPARTGWTSPAHRVPGWARVSLAAALSTVPWRRSDRGAGLPRLRLFLRDENRTSRQNLPERGRSWREHLVRRLRNPRFDGRALPCRYQGTFFVVREEDIQRVRSHPGPNQPAEDDDAIPFPDPYQRKHWPQAQREADGRHGPADRRNEQGRGTVGYRRPAADRRRQARAVVARKATRDRWAIHGNQGGDRWLRDAEGRLDGGCAEVDLTVSRRAWRRVGSRVRGAAA